MYWTNRSLLLFSMLWIFPVQPAVCQQAVAAKDSRALTLAANTLSLMGGAAAIAANDSRTVASVSVPFASTPSVPVTIETSGTKKIRSTTEMAKGSLVSIVNSGVGERIQPDGSVAALPLDLTLAARVDHLPALSLLAEANDPSVEVLYVGTDIVGGAPCDVISLSLPTLGKLSDADAFRDLTKTSVWIDQKAGLVLKMSYKQRQSQPTPGTYQIDQFYTNYQTVQGVAVPFTQTLLVDGQLTSTLSIKSIQFNVGIPDSDFATQGAN